MWLLPNCFQPATVPSMQDIHHSSCQKEPEHAKRQQNPKQTRSEK